MTTLRLLPKFLASLLLPITMLSACTPQVRNYGGGGGGAGGGSSSSSGGMQCASNDQCGANSECQSFACVNGACEVNFAPMGTPVALQAMGDCQSKMCDGKGYLIEVADPLDAADDGNPCTLDTCVANDTQHEYVAAGMSCNGTQFCDGFGYCIECVDNSQCTSGVCVSYTCAAPACSDLTLNGSETDIDCGGADCPPCTAGNSCANNADCKSLVCIGAQCAAPTCTDMATNGQESSVDCGGPDCLPCPAGKSCNAAVDCISNVCVAGTCKDPTCSDMVMNGGESDIDCGGSCSGCGNGRGCFNDGDCFSSNCCPGEPGMPGYCEKPFNQCLIPLRSDVSQ